MTGAGKPAQHPSAHLLLHRSEVFGCQRASLTQLDLLALPSGEHPVDYAAVEMDSALQQFRDHPSQPPWWEDFVNNLGQTEAERNPNNRIRVVGPGTGG